MLRVLFVTAAMMVAGTTCVACSSGDSESSEEDASLNLTCENTGTKCRCFPDSNADTPSSVECNAHSFDITTCCATPDYPAAGECSCLAKGCTETATSCDCGTATGAGVLKPACEQSWATCCAHETGGGVTVCYCNNSGTCDGNTQVTNCDVYQLSCFDFEESAVVCN
jgi:hypothetical protein